MDKQTPTNPRPIGLASWLGGGSVIITVGQQSLQRRLLREATGVGQRVLVGPA
ncbi:MAG TPA: hypothetical protein VF848_01330 [Steroidobacteraceae bacterium]